MKNWLLSLLRWFAGWRWVRTRDAYWHRVWWSLQERADAAYFEARERRIKRLEQRLAQVRAGRSR